jgi:hypothetical protein
VRKRLFFLFVGSASQFLYQPVDPIATPWRNGEPTYTTQITGNYPARTYYYAFSWVTTYGETLISPVTSYALSSHVLFKLTVPKFWYRSIVSARVYVGLTASVTAQADVTTSNGSWTELDIATPAINGLVAGSAFPTTNTATEKIYVILSEDEIKIIKRNPAIYSMQVSFEEVF